ncbi:hypothetical protein PMAYCL1PPCAC_03507 [Pristionchus mayeri]|uniref:Uncharacterized protein n=1 Tax=Pristionchus mayeri TaxID=1317129 RepID=A0AAN4Z8M2_9BILA|nr:hypothetical protein PMAYCL1PPCAC_03507 [Pristionchus mayeri]
MVEIDRWLVPIENIPHDVRDASLLGHLCDCCPQQLTVPLVTVLRPNYQFIHRHCLSFPAIVREVVDYHTGWLFGLIVDDDESSEATILKVLGELLSTYYHFRF